jgi:hypothetical protein
MWVWNSGGHFACLGRVLHSCFQKQQLHVRRRHSQGISTGRVHAGVSAHMLIPTLSGASYAYNDCMFRHQLADAALAATCMTFAHSLPACRWALCAVRSRTFSGPYIGSTLSECPKQHPTQSNSLLG